MEGKYQYRSYVVYVTIVSKMYVFYTNGNLSKIKLVRVAIYSKCLNESEEGDFKNMLLQVFLLGVVYFLMGGLFFYKSFNTCV